MSYFRVALQRETERRNLQQKDLAERAGLSRSYINRLLSGDHADLSDDNFVAILKAFAADKRAQAELTAARCMDVRVGPAADLVEISLKNSAKAADADVELPHVHLSKETERAFAWLRSQCPLNSDLEKHLVGYAKLTGMK
jgi:transcriptional regulator with XRE-family HTH domain